MDRSEFHSPEELLATEALTRTQKLSLLRDWEQDLQREAASVDEGLAGGDPPLLARVERALVKLRGDATPRPRT
jgi:hypothetical protein